MTEPLPDGEGEVPMCPSSWLPPALSSIPTELCLVTPGFVPSTLVTEIIINQEGDFVVPCLNGVFRRGIIVKEIVDYTLHNSINMAVIFHELSTPIEPPNEKTFVLVPVSRIRKCELLDEEALHFFGQLLEAWVPDHERHMLCALISSSLSVVPVNLVKTNHFPTRIQSTLVLYSH